MTILCLESSADPTVIGLVRDRQVLVERVFSNRDELVDSVANILKDAELKPADLGAIAVGIGPGSFTGLRVSLAFAKGMARGLGIPIWPISSFKIVAANVRSETERIGVITHARRGQVHFAVCHAATLSFLHEPAVIVHEELLRLKDEMSLLLGPGIRILSEKIREELSNLIPDAPEQHQPHSEQLADLALAEWSDKSPPDPRDLEPEYGLEFGT